MRGKKGQKVKTLKLCCNDEKAFDLGATENKVPIEKETLTCSCAFIV